MFGVNLLTFVVASFLGRGTRFYIVGLLSEKYGERALQVILKKYDKVLLVLGITVLVAIYFLLSK
jgi:membrane protein DedA with SNARE-associated domain